MKHGRFLVRHQLVGDTLVLDLGSIHRVLSSAPRGGGFVRARSILNHQVQANPTMKMNAASSLAATKKWGNPSRYLGELGRRLGLRGPTVGLMTAVPMKQLVKVRETHGTMWVECFCTVGVTNAVRAGEPAIHPGTARGYHSPGTINIIVVTNATLSGPAMVGAIQVATESKTAILTDNRVRSASGRGAATGTGTDAVVIASSRTGTIKLAYSGTHTVIGSVIGRLVARCVQKGLERSVQWRKQQTRSIARSRHR